MPCNSKGLTLLDDAVSERPFLSNPWARQTVGRIRDLSAHVVSVLVERPCDVPAHLPALVVPTPFQQMAGKPGASAP